MRWAHGELLDEDNVVFQFRYDFDTNLSKTIEKIETRYMPGSMVLWIEEGFLPEDTSRWEGWAL